MASNSLAIRSIVWRTAWAVYWLDDQGNDGVVFVLEDAPDSPTAETLVAVACGRLGRTVVATQTIRSWPFVAFVEVMGDRLVQSGAPMLGSNGVVTCRGKIVEDAMPVWQP